MLPASDRIATLYVGHARSGTNVVRDARLARARAEKVPSKSTLKRRKRATEQVDHAPPNPNVEAPDNLPMDPFAEHGYDEGDDDPAFNDIFRELNQEAMDVVVDQDGFGMGGRTTRHCLFK